MPTAHEFFSEQFEKWEKRGRGWQVFAEPVYPEPPFAPFAFRPMAETPAVDDGVRPTLFSSLMKGLSRKMATTPPPISSVPEPDDEPEPTPLVREGLIEFQASLSDATDLDEKAFQQFFRSLSLCREPFSFELLGTHNRIAVQFATGPDDVSLVRKQLLAHFPAVPFREREGALEAAWDASQGEEVIAVEFGLEREFMFSLAASKSDPFVGIIGALSELHPGELGLFQVLWQSVRHPWAENIKEAVTQVDGKPLFVNFPELTGAAGAKLKHPLYAAVVRLMLRTDSADRLYDLARQLAGSLRVFTNPEGNALIPLHNEDYPYEQHIEDVFLRQSRRTGMLLNAEELAGFVHLPGNEVRSPALKRDAGETKAAPPSVQGKQKLLLGYNEHAGDSIPVYLSPDQRTRHSHVIGTPGTGKSNFIFNLVRQDIENGEGVALFDPHGDTIEKVLGCIPEARVEDVILLDPADEEYSVPFNILSAHSELEKRLIASDLTAVFQRLSTSWGDQMTSVLNNAILAFLESSKGGTLSDMRRFLIEPGFRAQFLKTVNDPNVVYYWQKGFPHLVGNKSIGPLVTRLDMLLAPKPISYMVSQKENRLDFSAMMNTGKIFLAKLSQGTMGYENSSLMGSLLMAKFHLAAISRQNIPEAQRRPFYIYLDEAHNFATPSMVEILTGARKYRVGLILAHQELSQLERVKEIGGAIMGCYTRVVFRVGDSDARKLSEGFSHFEAKDLQNLETGHAICKVERADHDFNLAVPFSDQAAFIQVTREAVVKSSRAKYATPRAEVEKALWEALRSEETPPSEPLRTARKDSESFRSVPKSAEKFGTVPNEAEPKNAEIQKPTATQKEKPVVEPKVETKPNAPPAVPPPAIEEKPTVETPAIAEQKSADRDPQPPRDLGRGGAQHKAIQERLQTEAHALGFLAEVERTLENSKGAADLALRLGKLKIAVEISVTTTTDHEFGNVKKCLDASFDRVAMVSPSPERLGHIEKAVKAGLGMERAGKVSFHTPDDFIAELIKIASEATKKVAPPSIPSERTTRGYKIKRHGTGASDDERKAKEKLAVDIMTQAMKQKP